MKIFVSSTVKDLKDLRDGLYCRLKELRHTPWFSEMGDFPTDRHPDAMTNCLTLVEECDQFVLLLDKFGGLIYTEREGTPYPELFGLRNTEAEYRCARAKSKPVHIFIRKRADHESALYRQMNTEQRKLISWYSEPAVYEFYDRLMHETPHIPWRYTFESIQGIMGPLNAILGVGTGHRISYSPEDLPDIIDFVNRNAEQNNLEELIKQKKHMIIIQGIAGIGKTQIAAKFMENIKTKGDYITYWRELRDAYSFDLIINDSKGHGIAGFLRENNDSELADYI